MHAIGWILFLALLLSPGVVGAQTIEWTKLDNGVPWDDTVDSGQSSTNGKIPRGTANTGDDTHTYAPSVLKDGDTYKMWYTGHDGAIFRIYYATSSNGLEWTKLDNGVPADDTVDSGQSSTNGKIPRGTAGKGDATHTGYPWVIKDGSTYKMWYGGHDGAIWRIYYATSSNGLEWTKYDNGIPEDSDGSSTNGKIPRGTATTGDGRYTVGPCVLKDGATYKMWYSGASTSVTWRIYYATSSNGLEWTKNDNTVPENSDGSSTNGKIPLGSSGKGDQTGVLQPSVIKDGSTYKMWYTGRTGSFDRVYYATSSNGLEWTKYDNTIPPNSNATNSNGRIGLGEAGRGDNASVLNPSVLKDDATSTYKMWYSGWDGAGFYRVYYATAPIPPPPAGTIFTFR